LVGGPRAGSFPEHPPISKPTASSQPRYQARSFLVIVIVIAVAAIMGSTAAGDVRVARRGASGGPD
jgi:hypothetical protein